MSEKVIEVQDTDFLFDPVPLERFQSLTRSQLIEYLHAQQDLSQQLTRINRDLKRRAEELEDKTVLLGEEFVVLKHELYGKSSERLAALPETAPGDDFDPETAVVGTKPPRKKRVRLPSLRYPNAPLIERHVTLETPDPCGGCGARLSDSCLTEDREFITKVPAQFYVVRERRHKYRCGSCYGSLVTAPGLPAIKSGSAFSDEFIQEHSGLEVL